MIYGFGVVGFVGLGLYGYWDVQGFKDFWGSRLIGLRVGEGCRVYVYLDPLPNLQDKDLPLKP